MVKFPDAMTTNICFGGPDMRRAFVTLSSTGQLVALDWTDAGWDVAGLRLNYEI